MDNQLLKFEALKDKMKSFSQLPQPEYAAVARIVLEEIGKVSEELYQFVQEKEISESVKFMVTVAKLAETGATMTIQFGQMDYTISATATKTKK